MPLTLQVQHIGLTPNFPAKIVPINLPEFGGRITIKSRAFMCSLNAETTFSYRFAGVRHKPSKARAGCVCVCVCIGGEGVCAELCTCCWTNGACV